MKTNTQDLTKGYKGYNSDFTCAPQLTPYQYAENTIHELRKYEELKCCVSGFHYCPNPLDVLDFYSLIGDDGKLNIFTKVEALGNIDTDDNIKYATDKIKIGEKLSFNEYVKECIGYIEERCENGDDYGCQIAKSNDYFQIAMDGYKSKIATSGSYSQIATSGGRSQIATSGYKSQIATSGNYSQVATSGDFSKVATSDYGSRIATSGDFSKVATSGDCSQVTTSGGCSKIATSGDDSRVNIQDGSSVVANIGKRGKIKGVIGTWITLAEYDKDGKCTLMKCGMIDGINLKPDTWYSLENGEFIETII